MIYIYTHITIVYDHVYRICICICIYLYVAAFLLQTELNS